jgi:hypothetical protein
MAASVGDLTAVEPLFQAVCDVPNGGGVQPVARARYAASGVLKSGSLAAYPG